MGDSKRKIKVCFVDCIKSWGGGEKWHLDHAAFMQKQGHHVVLIVHKNSTLAIRAAEAGLKTENFSIGNLSFLNPFKRYMVKKFLKKENFDSVVINSSSELKIVAPIAKRLKIRNIIYERGCNIPIRDTKLNRYLFRHCLTDILVNSLATKTSVLQNNPDFVPEEKIKLIYNGVDIAHYQGVSDSNNAIPVIGILGRLSIEKRQDLLLETAAILKKRQIKCLFKIGGDGVLMEELQAKAKMLHVDDIVQFLGFVQEPKDFFSQIDIFALTSEREGFGYVSAEAMACRKPVIAFHVASNPELIENGETGFLVPWDNCELFADAVQKLVENPALRKEMGEKAYKVVCDKFDFAKNRLLVEAFLMK